MAGLLDSNNAAGWAAEGKRLAVDLPEVTAMDAARFIAEATPIIGDAMAAKEVWDEATSESPNWALVGALGGATLLGLIPGVGDAAAKAVKAGARGLLDTAKRVEVDPNTMGSLLGNVRLKPKVDAGDVAKPTAAELRRQANIQRFGYDPNEVSTPPSRTATEDAGFESYLEQVNPGGKRIAAEDRPNLAMGDMYGMMPKGSDVVGSSNGVTFHRGSDGNYYATAFNPDVGEEDVIGYITNRGDGTELAVVQEMQGKGVGGELQYLFRNENPNAPTGGLTEAGEASLSKTYQRLEQEGLLAPAPPKIRAYQGTPHKFSAERLVRMPDGSEQYIVGSPDVLPDIPAGAEVLEDFPLGRMRMDKIGTGEGAQVYGHGLYSAEAEDVARVYKDQLSGGASSAGQAKLDRYKGDIDAALNDTLSNLKRLDERELSGDFVGDEKRLEVLRVMHTKVLRQLDDYKTNGVFSSGSMYEININADPENFLDWDKTVGSQSQNVKSLLGWTPDAEQAYLSARNADDDVLLSALSADASGQNYTPTKLPIPAGSPPYSATGREIAGKSNLFGSGVQAAEALKEKGIPGIKYLDADSRSAGQGSRNYVVFDEKLINIVKRYGVAGAAAMLGVTAMDVEQAMAQGMQQPSGLLTPDMINSQQANQRPYNAGLLQ